MKRTRAKAMKATRGDRLRSVREAKGLSQSEAAKALGRALATYSGHERAQHPGGRDYDPEEARDYARYFGTTVNWLMTGEGKPETDERLTIATSAQVDALAAKIDELTEIVTKLARKVVA